MKNNEKTNMNYVKIKRYMKFYNIYIKDNVSR